MFESNSMSALFIKLLKPAVLILIVLISATCIQNTIAFFFTGATSEGATFKTGEWVPAHTTVQLLHNGKLYSHHETVSSYVNQDTDVYTVAYDSDSPQFLSFEYRIKRTEELQIFDQPVARVYFNSHELLQIRSIQEDTGWLQVVLDISEYNLESGVYDLLVIPSDTFDSEFTPSVEVRSVTTTQLHAIPGDQLVFLPNKEIDFITVAYEISTTEEAQLTEVRSQDTQFIFPISDEVVPSVFSYWSTDLFANTEVQHHLAIHVHDVLLDSQVALNSLQTEGDGQVSVQLTNALQTISPIQVQAVATQHEVTTVDEWETAQILTVVDHHLHLRESQWQQFQQADQNLVFSVFPDSMEYLSLRFCSQIGSCSVIMSHKK